MLQCVPWFSKRWKETIWLSNFISMFNKTGNKLWLSNISISITYCLLKVTWHSHWQLTLLLRHPKCFANFISTLQQCLLHLKETPNIVKVNRGLKNKRVKTQIWHLDSERIGNIQIWYSRYNNNNNNKSNNETT